MENSSRKRLQLFGITEEQLRAALEAVLENEDKHEWNKGYRDAEKNARDYGNVMGLTVKKSLGQNFLIEPNILNAYARSGGSRQNDKTSLKSDQGLVRWPNV